MRQTGREARSSGDEGHNDVVRWGQMGSLSSKCLHGPFGLFPVPVAAKRPPPGVPPGFPRGSARGSLCSAKLTQPASPNPTQHAHGLHPQPPPCYILAPNVHTHIAIQHLTGWYLSLLGPTKLRVVSFLETVGQVHKALLSVPRTNRFETLAPTPYTLFAPTLQTALDWTNLQVEDSPRSRSSSALRCPKSQHAILGCSPPRYRSKSPACAGRLSIWRKNTSYTEDRTRSWTATQTKR